MSLDNTEKEPAYFCPKCKNYFAHALSGVYFTSCPDCDWDPDDCPHGIPWDQPCGWCFWGDK